MTSFNPGDHVAIISGRHAGDIGKVVAAPCLRGVPVRTDRIRYYDEKQLVLDIAREGAEALAGEVYRPEAFENGRPLPRRPLKLTLGQFWAAQAARRSPGALDVPIAYVPVQNPAPSNVVTLSFGGVA